MNPSSLPPQGRYSDPRIQQMVLDELGRKDIRPEKFYFTSDDWMVSYDGPVPAWNSVFGIAPYRKDGQTYYAECGVSQRYDPHTAQWGEPAATVKEGLPLSDADFEAAPGAVGGDAGAPDSSGTVLASSVPDRPGPGGAPEPAGAPDPASAPAQVPAQPEAVQPADQAVQPANQAVSPTHQPAAERAEDESGVLPGFVGSDDAQADAEGEAGQRPDDQRATDLATTPASDDKQVDAVRDWTGEDPGGVAAAAGGSSLAAAAQTTSDTETSSSTGRHAQPDEVEPAQQPVIEEPAEQDAVAGSESRQQPDISHPGGGSAIYGGDAIHGSGVSGDSRSGQANVSGYALTVRDDGTAELQVPLGGQVTLKWAGQ